MEPTNHELYDIIRRLSDRVDALESQTAKRGEGGAPTPSIGFDKWLDSCVVGRLQVEVVYATGDVMEAFKQCCLANFDTVPVIKCANKLCVWDDGKWTAWNDENTRLLIQEMWRKLVRYDVVEQPPDKTIRGETRDARTAQISQLRHKLYDVRKNRAAVNRWLNDRF